MPEILSWCGRKRNSLSSFSALCQRFDPFKLMVAYMVKRPPAMQETQVWCLSRGDPLEEGMATPSRILAWRIPWTEQPGRLQSMSCRKLDTTEWLTL